MISRISAWVSDLFRLRRRDEALTEEQAADIGLSRSDLEVQAYARAGVRDQMLRMAARKGLSERDLNDARWASVDIARTCARCGSSKVCLRYLNGSPTSFIDTDCPNAAVYAELLQAKEEDLAS